MCNKVAVADLIIDEWLWADLSGENTRDAQREAFKFLQAIYSKCDRVVTVKGSRFDQKLFGLWSQRDITRNRIARFYKDSFRYNSDKTVILEENELEELPEQLAAEVKDDDQYLVRAYLTSNASEFVTTDNDLKDVLIRHGIASKHRQEFVLTYISQYGQK